MDGLTPALQHWQAQGGMVALGGHRLFVAQAGQHGSVLLFIHGYPTSSYDWHSLWAPLATRHRLIAPDLLGMGFSDKPADHAYGIENHADLLEALLDRLGVQQVHIVAHDLGVSVPLGFAIGAAVQFVCTARAFGSRAPLRDALIALAVSLGAFFLFVEALGVNIGAGVLEGAILRLLGQEVP